jgi:hypothetical protein
MSSCSVDFVDDTSGGCPAIDTALIESLHLSIPRLYRSRPIILIVWVVVIVNLIRNRSSELAGGGFTGNRNDDESLVSSGKTPFSQVVCRRSCQVERIAKGSFLCNRTLGVGILHDVVS